MELKKIFPKWWHPAIPAVNLGVLSFILTLADEEYTIGELIIGIMLFGIPMMYIFIYIAFVFCRIEYLVLLDIVNVFGKSNKET